MILDDFPTWALACVILLATFGTALLGGWVGRRARHLNEHMGEGLGVLQGALLGVVGLILAFGLSLGISRYEGRRVAVVDEANAITNTYLQAQLLEAGDRGRALALTKRYSALATHVAENAPGSTAEKADLVRAQRIQNELWAIARESIRSRPEPPGAGLFAESVNDLIAAQETRKAAMANSTPNAVFWLQIFGATVALALLAAYVAMIGRGERAVLIVSALVALILFVNADLDRPTKGLIKVPDAPMRDQYEEIHPAARTEG